MPESIPRPRGTQEGAKDDDYLHHILKPSEIVGSAPLVVMACGKTPAGTGFALLRSTIHDGPKTSQTIVFQRRWLDAPETTEEALVVMFQALRWYLENEGIPLP